jgi:transcriptional regulator with XRE-family HTH domain
MGEPNRGLEGLGKHLRRVRQSKKMSLGTVADLAGGFKEPVTKSHLSRIENGHAEPSFRRLYALCRIYGVSVTALAERYELDLLKEDARSSAGANRSAAALPPGEMFEEARELRMSGDYLSALGLYEMLLETGRCEVPGMQPGAARVHIRVQKVYCLIQLACYHAAHDEAMEILDEEPLNAMHKRRACHCMAMIAWRQGQAGYASMMIEKALECDTSGEDEKLLPSILLTQGNIYTTKGRLDDALVSLETALGITLSLQMNYQSCLIRRSLANVYLRKKHYRKSRELLFLVLKQAEREGYEKQLALALGDLGVIAWHAGEDHKVATYCRRSNRIARSREYTDLVFRNCYYLWKVATRSGNEAAARTNLRTLRSYHPRVNSTLDEMQEFSLYLEGGEA